MGDANANGMRGNFAAGLKCVLATMIAPGLFPGIALGQSAPLATPGVTRAEVEPAKEAPPVPPSRVNIDQRQAFEAGACPLRDSDVRVDLQSIRYVGPDETPLAPELVALLGSVQPTTKGNQAIAAVCDVRDAANAALRNARYVASVQIPPQEIANGELRLTVVAARIVEVIVRGDAGPFRGALRPRIDQLKALTPLNERDAERILLLAGDVPGLDVQLVLRSAGTKPGEVIGEMTVTSSRLQLVANVQNAGSRQLGRELGTLRADLFGLTGAADRTFLALSNSRQFREQHVIQFGHELGLGASGLRAGTRISYAISQPSIRNLALRSETIIGGLDIVQPLLRRVSTSLNAGLGVEYLNQETRVQSGASRVPFTRDRATVVYGKLSGYTGDLRADGSDRWTLTGELEVRQGLNVFGASPRQRISDGFSPSRFDGDGRATVVRGTIDATVSPIRNVWLTASGFGQWANNALLNLEEFSIGNLTYGRGYDPGANGADRALAWRIEPRWRITGSGTVEKPRKFHLEVFGFYEGVYIRNLDNGTLENKRTLDSYGGGIRAILAGRVIFDLIYAKPRKLALTTDEARPTDRVLFSITTKILPWRAK